ncbi:MAG: transglycosylase SLT domain-containing protein [Bacteriovoracia bacterium]
MNSQIHPLRMLEVVVRMNVFLFLFSLIPLHVLSATSASVSENVINNPKLQLSKSDHILAEHIVNMMKFIDKGYINQEVLNKVLKQAEQSKHFIPFVPWLKEIHSISRLSATGAFIEHCGKYIEKKESLPLEKVLERAAGNYCRERALESIGRDIDKSQVLSDESTLFIQQNLKFFLTKKNKKNFAYFVQSQASRPGILKKLSNEVTSYSVRHQIVPSQEVLKDIVINEQITKLIQDKGFNPLQHKNVFYAEYGKLIEQGYKVIDKNPETKKVKEHYNFLKNYLELNQDHLPLGLCLNRMNDFAKAVYRTGFKELSRDIFKYIIRKNHKEIQEDAYFFYLWTYINHKDFKDALKRADAFGLVKNSKSISDSRLKFWLAYTHEALEQKSEAVTLYEDLVVNHPLSYYGIMATKKLQILKPDSPMVNFYIQNTLQSATKPTVDIKELPKDHIASLVRLKAWAKIDNSKLLNLELKRLRNHSMPSLLVKAPSEKQLALKSDLHLLNAQIIQMSENYLATFRYIYEILDKKEVFFNRQLLEMLYPQPYFQVLVNALKNQNIDPIILLSLIRQESVFNPHARSRVGARGLMQLMPTTAKRFRRSVRDRHLTNPKINIELGTKYFKNLMKRYDGNLVYVLAAYNAGESRVERWKNLYFDTDSTILMNIESIPFLETRNYVKLIFRNIFFYKLLLDKKEQIADSKEPNQIFDIKLGFDK